MRKGKINKFLLIICLLLVSSYGYGQSVSFDTTLVSWYGDRYHGRVTASGEIYNKHDLTAASPDLPFGTKVNIISIDTGECVTVRINDSGPFKVDNDGEAIFPLEPHPKRLFDLSEKAFSIISPIEKGVIRVAYNIVCEP